MADIKSLFTGLMLSLSKVEKKELAALMGADENSIQHENKVGQREIKVTSSKRFYELMEKADEIDRRRHAGKVHLLMEKRGIKGEVVRTFKNVRSSDMFESALSAGINSEFTFKTSNHIYKYANSAYILKNDDVLDLYINISLLNENQRLRNRDFSDMKYFGVIENHKYFLYGVHGFREAQITGGEMNLVFEIFTVMDGQTTDKINDKETIMTKNDLIDQRAINYPGTNFQSGDNFKLSL